MKPKYIVKEEGIIRDSGTSFYAGTTYVVKERYLYFFYVSLKYFASMDYAQSYCDALTELWNKRIS